MDSKFVKRNYMYLVYDILKKETSRKGKHYTADELCSLIESRYVNKPNRKTIYTIVSDLKQFGYDICLEKDPPNRGYYLDRRPVKQSDFALIVDGIASISNLTVNWKLDLIENLSNALGYDYNKVDMYEYDSRYIDLEDTFYEKDTYYLPDGETLVQSAHNVFEVITDAIAEKTQICVKFDPTRCIENFLLEEIDDKLKNYLKNHEGEEYVINPYQIFRNKDNIMFLLYYIKTYGSCYPFASSIYTFQNASQLEMRRDKADKKVYSLNLDSFENATIFREKKKEETTLKRIKFTISFGIHEDSELFEYMTYYLTEYKIVEQNGVKYVEGTYLKKHEKILTDLAFEYAKEIIICPPGDIYDELHYQANLLAANYLDKEKQND